MVSEGEKEGDSFLALPSVALLQAQEKWRKLNGGVLNNSGLYTSQMQIFGNGHSSQDGLR